ncbi:MAG: hypothetical protein ACJA0Y_000750 [Maricaulis maris]|jgi:hypothetical protein
MVLDCAAAGLADNVSEKGQAHEMGSVSGWVDGYGASSPESPSHD